MAPVSNIVASVALLATAAKDASQSDYAPISVSCPVSGLNRAAKGLSTAESTYVAGRTLRANAALAAWLKKVDPAFDTTNLPVVGLTSSGGGYRALLAGAGVVQGLDGRDSNLATSGLFQGLTYYAGLSGGAWLLSSLSGNNWPTISKLRDTLWLDAFQDDALVANIMLASSDYNTVAMDLKAKDAAGFNTTIPDAWGRFISHQILSGPNGGVSERLSGQASKSNFTSLNVPFPIMTALSVDTGAGQCTPIPSSTQYEFTPYEFGSWDNGIRAFTSTAFLGTSLTNSQPTNPNKCTANFDNLGYMFGTSSDIFSLYCFPYPAENSSLIGVLSGLIPSSPTNLLANIPNPFYKSPSSPSVSSQPTLYLADGGLNDQINPIWPFLQPERPVTALIVSDNTADTDDSFPSGVQIRNTYLAAQSAGLTKMPAVPPPETFVAQGLNKRAVFFGCDDKDKLTIVWLPNAAYSFPSNASTYQVQFSREQTRGIIANGNLVASQNGTEGWGRCLGCALVGKTGGKLPDACSACFDKYCYRGDV
ncbi:lysophospholipase [Elsinoe ampelina]|uniref:Lysophospholipase n=1 Tax=Elsinoe ampelina TaxID=302913 RepID=A0A6A6FYH6_9PEZI|nr:lysophospholipase [Elsinoe ampelina]